MGLSGPPLCGNNVALGMNGERVVTCPHREGVCPYRMADGQWAAHIGSEANCAARIDPPEPIATLDLPNPGRTTP